MDTLYIVMPAYNEEKNIEMVVRQWYPMLAGKDEGSRLVIADSGSTDNTHMILERLRKELPKLEILSGTGKQHGPKLIALYNLAVKRRADYIFQTDSDGQTVPDEFAAFWKMREEYDAVLGYRRIRGDGRFRAFVERMVCFLLKIYFGIDVPDANAPFRQMRRSVVEKYIGRFPKDYNLPNIMLTAYFAYYKENITFKTVTFQPRQGGVNSINIRKIIKIGWNAAGDFRNFKKGMK